MLLQEHKYHLWKCRGVIEDFYVQVGPSFIFAVVL